MSGRRADTQKRASVALSLLIEQLQKDGGLVQQPRYLPTRASSDLTGTDKQRQCARDLHFVLCGTRTTRRWSR
eukprot:1176900-Rhodomonas_salina.2